MDNQCDSFGRNKTKEYCYKMCKIVYALGAPNYWCGDLGIPEYVKKIHDIIVKIVDLSILSFFVSTFSAIFTQYNLSEKQTSEAYMFCISLPCWYIFVPVFYYYKNEVRMVCHDLTVKLKEKYNDPDVEKEMVRCIKVYCGTYMLIVASTVSSYGIQGLMEVVYNGGNFVAISPVWPDILDSRTIGAVMRVGHYCMWWVISIRVMSSAYLEVIMITVCLSHQYKNLCSYFRSLNIIFENKELTQEQKEQQYEEAVIIGIVHHDVTLRCKKLTQKICYVICSIQIFINLCTITLLLFQFMISEKTLTNMLPILITIVCTLISTGCIWCCAGDVTVEGSKLTTAIFESGWQHCRGRAALRARSLVVVAMWHSQRPVEIRCLGIVNLSYSSYVKIVRLTYQVFSVLYSR